MSAKGGPSAADVHRARSPECAANHSLAADDGLAHVDGAPLGRRACDVDGLAARRRRRSTAVRVSSRGCWVSPGRLHGRRVLQQLPACHDWPAVTLTPRVTRCPPSGFSAMQADHRFTMTGGAADADPRRRASPPRTGPPSRSRPSTPLSPTPSATRCSCRAHTAVHTAAKSREAAATYDEMGGDGAAQSSPTARRTTTSIDEAEEFAAAKARAARGGPCPSTRRRRRAGSLLRTSRSAVGFFRQGYPRSGVAVGTPLRPPHLAAFAVDGRRRGGCRGGRRGTGRRPPRWRRWRSRWWWSATTIERSRRRGAQRVRVASPRVELAARCRRWWRGVRRPSRAPRAARVAARRSCTTWAT